MDGSPSRKGVATVIVIIFVTIASISTFKAIQDFFAGPGFNSEYTLVYTPREEAQPLAVFAICDVSPWQLDKARQNNVSVQMVSYLAFFIFPFEESHEIFDKVNEQRLQDLEEEYETLSRKFGGAMKLLDAVTRSCEDMIFYCKMGIRREMQAKDCCQSNFEAGVYTTEGKCWGTRDKMDFKQVQAVKPQGLTVALTIGPDISGSLDTSVGSHQATLQRGVAMVLAGAKDHLYTATTKRSYLIMPNTLNSVALEKTVIDSSSLHDCARSDDAEVLQAKTPGFTKYSRNNCELRGLQDSALAHIQCAIPMLPNPTNATECSPRLMVALFNARETGSEPEPDSDDDCPIDCLQETYTARVSSQQISEGIKAINRYLTNTTDEVDVDVVAFVVHYPSFDFIQTVQHSTVRQKYDILKVTVIGRHTDCKCSALGSHTANSGNW